MRQKGFVSILLLLALIGVVGVGIYLFKDKLKFLLGSIIKDTKPSVNLTDRSSMSNRTVDGSQVVSYSTLIEEVNGKKIDTGIIVYSGSTYVPAPVRWSDFIIQPKESYFLQETSGGLLGVTERPKTIYTKIFSVLVYDIKKHQSFEIPMPKEISGEAWSSSAQTFGNYYSFGYGGAFGANLIYKLILPPTPNSTIGEFKESPGSKVKKIGNFYIGSFCYEGCTYNLFDIDKETANPLQRMNDSSNGYISDRKEHFIGIDGLGREIIDVKDVSSPEMNNYPTSFIAAVPLDDESQTIKITTAEELPEKNMKFLMSWGINKILMIGKKVYIYNLDNNSYKELPIGSELQNILKGNEDDIRWHIYGESSNFIAPPYICFGVYDSNSTGVRYAIDLQNEIYLDEMPEQCSYYRNSPDSYFSRLNLDSHFSYEQKETEVK